MIAWVVTYAWHNRSGRLFQTLLIAQTANRSLRCGGGRARNPSRPGGQHSLHLTGRIYACSRNACELSHDIALAIPGGSIYAITLGCRVLTCSRSSAVSTRGSYAMRGRFGNAAPSGITSHSPYKKSKSLIPGEP